MVYHDEFHILVTLLLYVVYSEFSQLCMILRAKHSLNL